MKKMAKEFKDFIAKGNVLDMAIGVIIAGAFGKITTSVVNDILMPVIGAIFGGASLTDTLNITLRAAELDAAGEVVKPACVLGLGTLITAVIDFLIIALRRKPPRLPPRRRPRSRLRKRPPRPRKPASMIPACRCSWRSGIC